MLTVAALVNELVTAINLPALAYTVLLLFNAAIPPVALEACADNVLTLSSNATPALCAVATNVGENADVNWLLKLLVLV